ncbi:GNAT family N-acetyltransferase [bacterium]|nr:GNAT family N-acetyltransferase [bacterium]
MMLVRTHQLDDQQLSALDLLCAECKAVDGNLVATYRHLLSQDRPIPCNILYYQKHKLIGFLRTFFFYTHICEIAAMVAPHYRKRGIASKMLNDSLPLIIEQDIHTLVFSSPHQLNDAWLPTKGFTHQGSEYQMQYQNNATLMVNDKSANVRIATQADISTLSAIDTACFPAKEVDMAQRFFSLLCDPNYTLFIVSQHGVPVGKAHLYWQPDGARLTDIAVIPRAQGRGLGSTLITYCIQHAIKANKPNIVLDVETINQSALNLYFRLGFIITNAHDYWTIPLLKKISL